MSIEQLDQYRRKVQKLAEEEEKKLKDKQPQGGGDEPPIEFVKECYNSWEVGDSRLYNYMFRDKFLFSDVSKEPNKDTWLRFVGPHWDTDYKRNSKASVEAVAVQYLRLLESIDERLKKIDDDLSADPKDKDLKEERKIILAQRKELLARVRRLRSDAGRNAVLSCAISNDEPITAHPNEMDRHPWLFPCANGVVDLSTGEFDENSDPKLYLTTASPIRWEGLDAQCKVWEQYLFDVLGGERESIEYLQKVLGYAITGLNTERIFIVLHGPHGQNGKGTLMTILLKILGTMASTVQTEVLMSQRYGKSPSGPSPEIIQFKGKRLLFAEETERKHSFASGQLKKFSGGGTLKGRGVNDREYTEFDPTHVLFLLCNELPNAPASDDAFWFRIKVFKFPYSFVDDPSKEHHRTVDRKLEKKLMAEAPGILAWLVKGCLKWQKSNLVPPPKVAADSKDYREREDNIQTFIDECCQVDLKDSSPNNRTAASSLYTRYKSWLEVNDSTRPLNQKDFSEQIQLKGFRKVKSGKNYYQFITLKIETDD